MATAHCRMNAKGMQTRQQWNTTNDIHDLRMRSCNCLLRGHHIIESVDVDVSNKSMYM